jgi:hypothetical protein
LFFSLSGAIHFHQSYHAPTPQVKAASRCLIQPAPAPAATAATLARRDAN